MASRYSHAGHVTPAVAGGDRAHGPPAGEAPAAADGPARPPPPPGRASSPGGAPAEVWENQRFYGFGWQGPGPLERPAWSDAAGGPLAGLTHAPSPARGWGVAVTDHTDDEGWTYGSAWARLESDRPGGRASQRVGDLVRRRRWDRLGGVDFSPRPRALPPAEASAEAAAVAAATAAAAAVAAADVGAAARARRAGESARRLAALRAFVSLLVGAARRRRVWTLLPGALDPGAIVVLAGRHAAALAEGVRGLAGSAVVELGGAADGPSSSSAPAASPYPPARTLARAAVLSKAAYGYAAAAGHLASVSAYARMHTVGRAVELDVSEGVSAGANAAAAAGLAGLDPSALLASHWAGALHRPAHFVAVDADARRIVIAVRGTLGAGDALGNLAADPMEVRLLGTAGHVHAGMMAAATFVHCATAGPLRAAADKHPDWPVLVVGHSMGGGVASILAALLVDGGGVPGLGPISAVAVGPAAVFSAPLADAVEPFVTSVVLGADVVPRLSVASVEGALVELAGASPTLSAAAGLGAAVAGLGAAVADLAAAAAAVVAPPPPPPPGRAGDAGLGAVAALAAEGDGGGGRGGGRAAADAAAAVAAAALGGDQAPPAGWRRSASPAPRPAPGAGPAPAAARPSSGTSPSPAPAAPSPPAPPPRPGPSSATPDHPEALLVAGRILWVLPPGELARAASAAAEEVGGGRGGDGGDAAAAAAAAAATTTAAAAAASTSKPLVLAAPRDTFARLLLTTDAAVDHLPDAYVAALDGLVDDGLEG